MNKSKLVKLSSKTALWFVLFAAITFSLAFAYNTPQGIKGFILDSNGNEVSSGLSFSVNDTSSGDYTNGTSGISGHPGFYSVTVNGNVGDLVAIKAWNSSHYGLKLVELNGDMEENITINIDNNAPYLTPVTPDGEKGVWITPEMPANNTDLVCNYYDVTDPNGDTIELNYLWYKNRILQNDALFELGIDNNTIFLARFDTEQNATYAAGNKEPILLSGTSLASGKINNGINFSTGEMILFNSTGNFNTSGGTVEFWIKMNSQAVASPVLFETGSATADLVRISYTNSSKTLSLNRRGTTSLSAVVNLKVGEWHYIAITFADKYDENYGGYSIINRLYVDGQLRAQRDSDTTPMNQAANFSIGSRITGANRVDAVFDEFRISNKEKSPYEIFADYSRSVLLRNKVIAGDSWSCKINPSDNLSLSGYSLDTNAKNITNYSVSFLFNDYTSNEINTTLKAGKPNGLQVDMLENGVPISGAIVKVYEYNGYSPFAFVQTVLSNITSTQIAEVKTNSSGTALLTLIPSGGREDTEKNSYENTYSLVIEISYNDKIIYRNPISVEPSDRVLTKYKANYQISNIPNYADISNVDYGYSRLYDIYIKLYKFISDSGGG